MSGGSTPKEFAAARARGVPPLRFRREERILAIAVRAQQRSIAEGSGRNRAPAPRSGSGASAARRPGSLRRGHANRRTRWSDSGHAAPSRGIESHEIDPVHAHGSGSVRGPGGVSPRRKSGGCASRHRCGSPRRGSGDVAPERHGVEEADVVRGLVEVIEDEIAEPQTLERADHFIRRVKGGPSSRSARAGSWTVSRRSAVASKRSRARSARDRSSRPAGTGGAPAAMVNEPGCRRIVVVGSRRLGRLGRSGQGGGVPERGVTVQPRRDFIRRQLQRVRSRHARRGEQVKLSVGHGESWRPMSAIPLTSRVRIQLS